MASFGENLRREREMRGVTLQEISTATKISVRFLQALEKEDFGQLPGGIFTRSFIRAFAKYLGLDEDRVLAEYHLVAPAKSDLDLSRMTVSRPEAKRDVSRAPLFAVLVAALLLTSGYLLYRYTRATAGIGTFAPSPAPTVQAPPAPTPAATGEASSAPASVSPMTAAGQTAIPGQETEAGAASVLPGMRPAVIPVPENGLVLQIAATERAWVAVDADRKMVLQRILSPGEIETVRAKESFDVTTGNALGIVLTLDGETLKPLGRRGEVKSVHLTRNDALRTSP